MMISASLRRLGQRVTLGLALACPTLAWAIGTERFVAFEPAPATTALIADGRAAPILVDSADWPGVRRAAGDLQSDFERVAGIRPTLGAEAPASAPFAVIVGTLGKSPLIDSLAKSGKLDTTGIAGRWEAFQIETVDQPLPGIDRALVIAGSDKRGTIYGIYELSQQIGVSPWYW